MQKESDFPSTSKEAFQLQNTYKSGPDCFWALKNWLFSRALRGQRSPMEGLGVYMGVMTLQGMDNIRFAPVGKEEKET